MLFYIFYELESDIGQTLIKTNNTVKILQFHVDGGNLGTFKIKFTDSSHNTTIISREKCDWPLFANTYPFFAMTFLTFDLATPMKFTKTLFYSALFNKIMAAPAAHR